MSTSNEANQDTITISSDDDDGSGDEEYDDRKARVVLAVLPPEKRVFRRGFYTHKELNSRGPVILRVIVI